MMMMMEEEEEENQQPKENEEGGEGIHKNCCLAALWEWYTDRHSIILCINIKFNLQTEAIGEYCLF